MSNCCFGLDPPAVLIVCIIPRVVDVPVHASKHLPMAPNRRGKFQFINMWQPGDAASPESQHNIHAHAARAAHASRAKRFRIIECRVGKPSQNRKYHKKVPEQSIGVEPANLPVPSPLTLLFPGPGEPFNSFARPLMGKDKMTLRGGQRQDGHGESSVTLRRYQTDTG